MMNKSMASALRQAAKNLRDAAEQMEKLAGGTGTPESGEAVKKTHPRVCD